MIKLNYWESLFNLFVIKVTQPTRVDEIPDNLCESSIKAIEGGGGHTLLLTNSGKLYGAGWNESGQVWKIYFITVNYSVLISIWILFHYCKLRNH